MSQDSHITPALMRRYTFARIGRVNLTPDEVAILMLEVERLSDEVRKLQNALAATDTTHQFELASLRATVQNAEIAMAALRGRDALVRAENARLRAALDPFAALGTQVPASYADEAPVWAYNDATITYGDLRQAMRVIGR